MFVESANQEEMDPEGKLEKGCIAQRRSYPASPQDSSSLTSQATIDLYYRNRHSGNVFLCERREGVLNGREHTQSRLLVSESDVQQIRQQ